MLIKSLLLDSLFEYHIELVHSKNENEKKEKKYRLDQCCIAYTQLEFDEKYPLTSSIQ